MPESERGTAAAMEDFWLVAFWVVKVWLCLVLALIMVPAMFGFSLGISETYMDILIQTLEVLAHCLRLALDPKWIPPSSFLVSSNLLYKFLNVILCFKYLYMYIYIYFW